MRKRRSAKEVSLVDDSSIKVVIAGCVAIAIALLVMVQSSIMITRDAVVQKLKSNDLGNLAASIGSVIEGKIDKATDLSLLLATDPALMEWVLSREQAKVAGSLVEQKMQSIVSALGYDTAFLVNDLTSHYWSCHDGLFELLDTVSAQDSADKWFFTAMKMGKRHEINIDHNKELDDTFVWINTLVGELEHPVAVTGLGMNLGEVIDELLREEAKNKVKNDIWLVDGAGTIQLAKDARFRNQQVQNVLPAALAAQLQSAPESEARFVIDEYVSPAGTHNDLAHKRIKDTAWTLIVQIPRSESIGFLQVVARNTVISCVLIILLMAITFYLFARRIADPYQRAMQLNQQLEVMVGARTRELQEKNAEINDSLEYAKLIQQTILPHETELRRNLAEHFIIFQPREAVGGDFYWMRSRSDGYLLVVGDCTGHGVPGALMTTAVNAMLNQISDTKPDAAPAEILQQLERLIRQSFSRPGEDELLADGLDAAVLLVAGGRVLFAGANIPILVADSLGVREIRGTSATIDCRGSRRDKDFLTHQLVLEQGSTLYLATDGYRDQPGGEKRLPFGKTRLLSLLAEIRELSLPEQADQLLLALEQYAGTEERRDDITILGFKL